MPVGRLRLCRISDTEDELLFVIALYAGPSLGYNLCMDTRQLMDILRWDVPLLNSTFLNLCRQEEMFRRRKALAVANNILNMVVQLKCSLKERPR